MLKGSMSIFLHHILFIGSELNAFSSKAFCVLAFKLLLVPEAIGTISTAGHTCSDFFLNHVIH